MPPQTTTTSTSSKPSKPPPTEYVETETGNRVSRRAQLHGTQHITLGGRCIIAPAVCIRADLVRPTPTVTEAQKKKMAPQTS
ncbi:hypothetical protein Q9189_008258, partial [Teloschistes chrysophthalmus]